MTLMGETLIYLGSAVVAVPLARRFGLGSVLGYLIAGVVIGPFGLGLIGDVDSVLHFAEIGVVFLLFLIGLELQPRRLWQMRRAVFGLGGSQVMISGALIGLIAWYALALSPGQAILVGLVLALSSTAFALQILGERNQMTTPHGHHAFATLLFQDLAVIPLLALIPLFGQGAMSMSMTQAGLALATVVGVIVISPWLVNPFFAFVSSSRNREISTAAALFIVVGMGMLMHGVGLSMSLGAFLAGVLLAECEFRHELESHIEPFKGLLLGLFFIAVGMSVDLHLIGREPIFILSVAFGLVALKTAVLLGLGRLMGHRGTDLRTLALGLSQGGEFAFVLFTVAVNQQVLAEELVSSLIVAVTISMALTPLLLNINDRFRKTEEEDRPYDTIDNEQPQVVIAGFGRIGQIIARILRMKGIRFTALESSFKQVEFVRRYGDKIYFGDPTRFELLQSSGVDHAKLFVLAMDDEEASLKTAALLRKHYPNLPIFARARNRRHAHRLMALGVTHVVRETYLSSLKMASDVLQGLGLTTSEALQITEAFRVHDEKLLAELLPYRDDEHKLIDAHQQSAAQLEELYQEDERERLT